MTDEKRTRLMTIDEVAKYLRIHKSTVYRLVSALEQGATFYFTL